MLVEQRLKSQNRATKAEGLKPLPKKLKKRSRKMRKNGADDDNDDFDDVLLIQPKDDEAEDAPSDIGGGSVDYNAKDDDDNGSFALDDVIAGLVEPFADEVVEGAPLPRARRRLKHERKQQQQDVSSSPRRTPPKTLIVQGQQQQQNQAGHHRRRLQQKEASSSSSSSKPKRGSSFREPSTLSAAASAAKALFNNERRGSLKTFATSILERKQGSFKRREAKSNSLPVSPVKNIDFFDFDHAFSSSRGSSSKSKKSVGPHGEPRRGSDAAAYTQKPSMRTGEERLDADEEGGREAAGPVESSKSKRTMRAFFIGRSSSDSGFEKDFSSSSSSHASIMEMKQVEKRLKMNENVC